MTQKILAPFAKPTAIIKGVSKNEKSGIPLISRPMSPSAYRKVTGFALMALVFIVVTGAAVRLTGSGLGCSDWPKCEENSFVAPLETHAMIEFINRLITGIVSVAVILAVMGSRVRVPRRSDLTWLSWMLVAGVVGQIVLGAFVVLSHLNPWLVLGHFQLSVFLVAVATILHGRAGYDPVPSPKGNRKYRWTITGLTLVAIFLGTLVTGSGPHSGSHDNDLIERLPFQISSITRLHAVTVITLIAFVTGTILRLKKTNAPKGEQWRARFMFIAICVQASIGYIQYFTGIPVILVGAHIAGSMLVLVAVLWFHMDLSPEPEEIAPGADSFPKDGSIMNL